MLWSGYFFFLAGGANSEAGGTETVLRQRLLYIKTCARLGGKLTEYAISIVGTRQLPTATVTTIIPGRCGDTRT